MNRKIILLLLLAASFTTCKKNDRPKDKDGCPTGACTAVFAMIHINYIDKAGNGVAVEDFKVKNLRTGKEVKSTIGIAPGTTVGLQTVADDGNRKEFSAEGDNVEVSATNPTTHQTKTVTLKISGGCNCHVDKLSGVATVGFD